MGLDAGSDLDGLEFGHRNGGTLGETEAEVLVILERNFHEEVGDRLDGAEAQLGGRPELGRARSDAALVRHFEREVEADSGEFENAQS